MPVEIPGAIRFEDDVRVRAYDREAVGRFRQALMHADRLLGEFRSRFVATSEPFGG